MSKTNHDSLQAGKHVLKCEIDGLQRLLLRIEEPLSATINLLSSCQQKIIVCGIGKSGHIGRKIAATLSSTGSRAIFLHPCEALHGDLGLYEAGDPVLLLSKSGRSEEIMQLIPIFKQYRSPIIAILGNNHNPIAEHSDIIFDINTSSEGDPLGTVPTISSLLTLAVGDAITCALMAEREFSTEDFIQFHPAGQIGRNLLLKVQDVMHPLHAVACVRENSLMRHTVIAMTKFPLGAALILNEKQVLGIITDGDIRRLLQRGHNIDTVTAADIMSRHFRFITPERSLGEAVGLMEEGVSQVTVLPVISGDLEHNTALGLIRLHDVYQRH
ncbi:MAG: KpsF/GutQ family sugar-phosphate isomerase [Puniceicoccales bacterium]|jgi:arabinose-5-phosphate isomerase|nr:KpsF/GutQ family sugar-phosphate isomerase [Puniceicoccales bacterium]